MPFTFSHPALVLPLAYLPKKWVSITGLVIGSITPDFEYFIRMNVQSKYSHTSGGLFWFDLPLGIALTFLFHNVVRDNLYNSLPTIFKKKMSSIQSLDWSSQFKRHWFIISISVLTGAFSHVLWDNFTHKNGFFVDILPLLNQSVTIFGNEFHAYNILQHSSSLVGAILIALALIRLPVDKTITGVFDFKYWTFVVGLTIVISVIKILNGHNFKIYGQLMVTGISAALIAMVLTSFIMKMTRKQDISSF